LVAGGARDRDLGRQEALRAATIRDYGEQWTRYPAAEGYLHSAEAFADVLAPLLDPGDVRGTRVADLGSGTGRVVNLLLDAGAAHVIAVEPSAAFEVLRRNTAARADRVSYLQGPGESLPPGGDLDYVFALGVLHHIPDPVPVVRAARAALRPGGRFVAWLYAREGNGVYLALARPARVVTRRLPHPLLAGLVRMVEPFLFMYMTASLRWPLPAHAYMRDVLSRLTPAERRLTLYDQLNPAYAKYYTRPEALELMTSGGLANVRIHHQHGYSWLIVAERPDATT